MGSRSVLIYFLATVFLISACGRNSTSTTEGDPQGAEDQSLLQFCTRFPNAQECNEINREADALGLGRYFGGGDDPFSDSAFDNSGIGCGCRNGENPVLFRGVPRCESLEIYSPVSQVQVTLRLVNIPEENESRWISTGDAGPPPSDGGLDEVFGVASCTPNFGARCNLERGNDDCRGIINRQGEQAECRPVIDTNYGFCDQRP